MRSRSQKQDAAKVVLTRESADNEKLALLLRADGLEVIDYPCIRTRAARVAEDRIEEIRNQGRIRAVVFTSRRAVEYSGAFLHEIVSSNREMIIAAIGDGTAGSLARAGFHAHLVSRGRTGERLGRELLRRLKPGDRVLHVRGNLTTGTMAEVLKDAGVSMDDLVVYENVEPELAPLDAGGDYVVVCASPSAVERFVKANPLLSSCRFVAIGPVTAGRMKELGIENIAAAEEPDNESLRREINALFEAQPLKREA
jgi:uroporphyrinogen-III synthase